MKASFYQNFMLSALLVISFDEGFARNLINNLAEYDATKSGNQNQIEKIFSQLIPKNDSIKATYDTYVDEKFSTICWNEITTLHFFKNGSHSGYVEYSISMELVPEIDADRNENDLGEKYEIYNEDTKTTKILDFVTVQSSLDDTVKKNKTVMCRSDKTYLKIFTNFGLKQRIEIRLKPDSHSLQFNLVQGQEHQLISVDGSNGGQTTSGTIQSTGSHGFSGGQTTSGTIQSTLSHGSSGGQTTSGTIQPTGSLGSRGGQTISETLQSTGPHGSSGGQTIFGTIQTTGLQENGQSTVEEGVTSAEMKGDFQSDSLGFTRPRIAYREEESQETKEGGEKLSEEVDVSEASPKLISSMYEPVSGEEAIDKEKQNNMETGTEEKLFTTQVGLEGGDQFWEVGADFVSQHPEVNSAQTKARTFTESVEDYKTSAPADQEILGSGEGLFDPTISGENQNIKTSDGSMTRNFKISVQKDHGCSLNKKVAIKMNMNIEDDAGKIGDIEKTIEIDLENPHKNSPKTGNFDEELISLIRQYYDDILQKHKLCPKNQHVPMMRSFMDTSNEFEHYYPYNYQRYVLRPQTTTGSLYSNPRKSYYVVARTNEDQNKGFLDKIVNGLKIVFRKLGKNE